MDVGIPRGYNPDTVAQGWPATTTKTHIRQGLTERVSEGIRTPDPRDHPASSDNDLQSIRNQGGAESGAVGAPDRPTDPDLQHLITAWPDLPDAVKAGITAMVQATTR